MTYLTTMRLDDDLAEAVKAYARANGGISIADAIRILLIKGLNGEYGPPAAVPFLTRGS